MHLVSKIKKEKVPVEGLHVCTTIERDAGYIEDSGEQCLLPGILSTLTDETLLPRIINRIHIATVILP